MVVPATPASAGIVAGPAHGVAVRFTAAGLPALGEDQDAALYRVAQEALHNALRHSGATRISVALSRTLRRVILEVADDGSGFAPGEPGGLGFASMRERAASAGGTLTIRFAPGAGTTIKLAVRLRRQAALEQASLEQASPEQASPEQASPEQASPEQASPEQAGPRTGSTHQTEADDRARTARTARA
jgi:hypothetical protein